MINIDLVIKIPENYYNQIKSTDDFYLMTEEKLIKYGTPLPKGHGDLIDRKELLKQSMDKINYPSNYVKIAPTIIEADKAESE